MLNNVFISIISRNVRFMAKKNIKELLNKYKENGVEHIEDNENYKEFKENRNLP